MNRNTLVTVLLVIAAAVIAWFLVGFIMSAIYWIFRLVVVAVIALVVFLLLRFLVFRASDE